MTGKQRVSILRLAVVQGLVIVGLIYLLSMTGLYRRVAHALNDMMWQFVRSPEFVDHDICLIAIDDKSLEYFSSEFNVEWPWPRQFYGLVLNYLHRAGAVVTVLDMLFTNQETGRIDVAGGSSDSEFAGALAENRQVVLAGMLMGTGRPAETVEDRVKGMPAFRGAMLLPESDFSSVEAPLAMFRKAAGAWGVANLTFDEDGVCRRIPLVRRIGDRVFPQLAFAAYLQVNKDAVVAYDPGENLLETRKKVFQLDDEAKYPIRWYGPGGAEGVYRYDSFAAVLLSEIKLRENLAPIIAPEAYRGKKVFICATAAGLLDYKPTPLTALAPYPAGEIHATLLNNLLASDRVIVPRSVFTWFALFGFLVPFGYLYVTRSMPVAVCMGVASLAFFVLATLILFFKYSVQVDLLAPLTAVLLCTATSTVYRVVTERRSKRRIRETFGKYMDKKVVDDLLKKQDAEKLESCIRGEEHDRVTVLFTDLQEFTSYSENREATEIVQILNTYFREIASIVLGHNGLLDKYTGDGGDGTFRRHGRRGNPDNRCLRSDPGDRGNGRRRFLPHLLEPTCLQGSALPPDLWSWVVWAMKREWTSRPSETRSTWLRVSRESTKSTGPETFSVKKLSVMSGTSIFFVNLTRYRSRAESNRFAFLPWWAATTGCLRSDWSWSVSLQWRLTCTGASPGTGPLRPSAELSNWPGVTKRPRLS